MVNLHQLYSCLLRFRVVGRIVRIEQILDRNVDDGELLLVFLTEIELVNSESCINGVFLSDRDNLHKKTFTVFGKTSAGCGENV